MGKSRSIGVLGACKYKASTVGMDSNAAPIANRYFGTALLHKTLFFQIAAFSERFLLL
jgi:hypothetical protein